MKFFLSAFIVSAILVVPLYPVYAQTRPDLVLPNPRAASRAAETASSSAGARAPIRAVQAASRAADPVVKREDVARRVSSRSALLKTRLAAFRDKAKAEVVQKVSDNLMDINEKRTDHFNKRLASLSAILDKVEKRASDSASEGKDTSTVTDAVLMAREKIASAQAAVDIQLNKDYALQISSESGVRNDAKKTRDLLHNDLAMTRKMVVDARAAVTEAIMTLAKVLGGANGQQ